MYALDAAMPFDFEAKANARLKHANALRIGIVGFGTFGQFLAKRLVQSGHKVILPMQCVFMLILVPVCLHQESLGLH